MVDIKNIPVKLKNDCRFCVWKFEKRSGQKTKMPYNPATSDRAKINDLRTFADFKTTLMAYAMGGFDGIGIAVGNGIGAFDIDHCIREDGTLNDTAATVLSIFPTAYVEKSPSGKGLRGFFCVPEDYVFDKTVYYINNRSKGLEVYMPGATNRFVTVTGDVYRTGEIPNDPEAMTTLLDSLMKRNKQVQNNQLRHHSYLSDDAVIAHAEEAGNSDKFKKLYAGDWQELYDSQSDADMAMLSILAFWCGCDEEQMDRIFRTSGLMRDKWDRKQAGTTYGAISIRNAVNTATSVYVPVNAQDIVDEEFSKLDEDESFQPDLSKITASLEEMAPHTNPRYGRDEIGMGNAFADYFKTIARYNSERGIWYVYDGTVWRADSENLRVAELAKLLADKLYVFALTITEEDARKRFIDRVKKLQLRRNRDNDDCIYTPGVMVFKSDTDYPQLLPEDKWYSVNVLTCAAPNLREKPSNSMNSGDGDAAVHISREDLQALHEKRMRKVLEIAWRKGIEVVILGAFGCGAFRNPPMVVAQAMKTVVQEYRKNFETIEFAIYCSPRDDANYRVFQSVLGGL